MLCLEDFEPGTTWSSSRRTLTDADIVNFAGVSGDFSALHMDDVFAATGGPFGRRVAHGLLVTVVAAALRIPALDDSFTLAYLEESRRFVGPAFPGDTLQSHVTVEDVRPSSSKPDRGVVMLAVEVRNQDGETVQVGKDVLLIGTRAAAQASA